MTDLTSNPTLPPDPSPREIARQARIDVLRRNGYDERRLAALEDQTPAPSVPDDLVTETPIEVVMQEIAGIVQPQVDAVIAAIQCLP